MLPSSFSTPLFFLSNSQIVNLTDDNDEPLLCLFFLIKTNPQVRNEAEIGLGLTGFGVLFSFLGIIFFFDKGFLAMGNILFLSGVMLTIGLKSTVQFFMKPRNYKGTISFGSGFFLVLVGWPVVGMVLEAYGFVVLFSGFWPTLAVFVQRIPIIGWVFQQPFITSFFDRYRTKRVPV
eukprot:TRINITY_DN3865_c1_g3_i1.p1 TRINITY_DN3865_c1_g3~~TRINITY_DN3865_c1_g3_i1.p1  ORF type:complete len:177 (-),score=22.44 TRINITY_DN3865_c1_g3_i1:232-762(-)